MSRGKTANTGATIHLIPVECDWAADMTRRFASRFSWPWRLVAGQSQELGLRTLVRPRARLCPFMITVPCANDALPRDRHGVPDRRIGTNDRVRFHSDVSGKVGTRTGGNSGL